VDFCKARVQQPGWVSNAFGRRRHFLFTADMEKSQLAGYEREAVNMPIQGTVADALNLSMCNLWRYRQLHIHTCHYKILLPVHDAVLLEVPAEEAYDVFTKVIPECMTKMTTIPPWQPDLAQPARSQAFNLDTERAVYLRWGKKPTEQELYELHVTEEQVRVLVPRD
jgi:hypothetical protein